MLQQDSPEDLAENIAADDLSGSRRINDEEKAKEYAEMLFQSLHTGEQGEEIRVSRVDGNAWEAWMGPEDDPTPFYAYFRTDGIVYVLNRIREFGSWRGSAGAYYDRETIVSTFMDPEELETVQQWALQEIERLNPGASGMLRGMEMESVRISGEEKFITLHAEPKDGHYDMGAYLDCVLHADGSVSLIYLTFAGNG